jgi:hypothetical protein
MGAARTTQKTSHVIANVTSLLLRGSVFTEPLRRSGLHNLVPLLCTCIAGCYRAVAWQCVDMSHYVYYRPQNLRYLQAFDS